MIIRAIDVNGDWLYGQGLNNFKRGIPALEENISTRLYSVLGDCFFAQYAGIDWFNFIGSKNELALNLAISALLLNTENVTGINQLSINLNHQTRQFFINYSVNSVFSSSQNPSGSLSAIVPLILTTPDGTELTTPGGTILTS